MIISDLLYLETASEASDVVGGRRRRRSGRRGGGGQSARGDRGNAQNASQNARVTPINFAGGNNSGSQRNDVDIDQDIDQDADNQANDNVLEIF